MLGTAHPAPGTDAATATSCTWTSDVSPAPRLVVTDVPALRRPDMSDQNNVPARTGLIGDRYRPHHYHSHHSHHSH